MLKGATIVIFNPICLASIQYHDIGIYIKYRKSQTDDTYTLSRSASYNDIFEISQLSFNEYYEFCAATIMDGKEIECPPYILKFDMEIPWILICMISGALTIAMILALLILFKRKKKRERNRQIDVHYSNTNFTEDFIQK